MSRIFDLTPEQQRAFNRLKKAYADCEKAGILFINNYGSLQAVDKKLICGYSDSKVIHTGVAAVDIEDAGEPRNRFDIASEWTDDRHFYELTELGDKLNELEL